MENIDVTTVTVHEAEPKEKPTVSNITKYSLKQPLAKTEKKAIWKRIGENIATYREMVPLTVEQLAELMNVDKDIVEKTEKGENKDIEDFMFLYRLAYALKINMQDLLEYENKKYYQYKIEHSIICSIEKYRMKMNIKIAEMCYKIGITQESYYYWLQGKYNPKVNNLGLILDFFKMSPDILTSIHNAYNNHVEYMKTKKTKKEVAVKKEKPMKPVIKDSSVTLQGIPESKPEIIRENHGKTNNTVPEKEPLPDKKEITKEAAAKETPVKTEQQYITPPAANGNSLLNDLNRVIYKHMTNEVNEYITKLDEIINAANKCKQEMLNIIGIIEEQSKK